MTPAKFAEYIRFRTKTNTSTFTDSDILLLANVWMDFLAARIVKQVDEDFFGDIYYADLAISNGREYPIPGDNMHRINRIEAMLDGENWIKLKEFDPNLYDRPTDEDTIMAMFANERGRAFYDLYRGSVFIYAGEQKDVADGLKMYGFGWPSHLTSLSGSTDMSAAPSTTSHGMPRAIHQFWADLIIIEYKNSQVKPMALNSNEQRISSDIELATSQKLDVLKDPNQDREIVADPLTSDETWDNGYDL